MTTTVAEKSRAAIISKCMSAAFGGMSSAEFEQWVNALPLREFVALIALHEEYQANGKIKLPRTMLPTPRAEKPLPYKDEDWTVYTGDGTAPTRPDAICFVLFPDGSVEGPNRADAFLWGDTGSAQILAWVPAISSPGDRDV